MDIRTYALPSQQSPPPQRPVEPLVQLECRYSHGVEGGGMSVGSGLLLDQRLVVTAAHLVAIERHRSTKSIAVRAHSSDGPVTLWVTGVSYPADWNRHDLAILRLNRRLPEPSDAVHLARVHEGDEFDATLWGYPTRADWRAHRPETRSIRARVQRGWLHYLSGRGVPGLSGGPLFYAGYAVGVHSGQRYVDRWVRSRQVAMPIVTDDLRVYMEKAHDVRHPRPAPRQG
ncbi:trypsin-like serine peptidase [Haliangium sp.]|uniref:trypsin-like serine peptidase n=1 Tax=Haliangium sp. TaxID=2663208 RepID=UPI003D11A062